MTVKKVYLVSSGEYSDYGIKCVFSTKETALEYIKLCHEYGDTYVNEEPEEYELDPQFKDPIGSYKFKYFYYVQMDRDGNVEQCNKSSSIDIMHPEKTKERLYFTYDYLNKKPLLVGDLNANNSEHAIKIMGEKRRKLIADGRWIDNLSDDGLYKNVIIN